METLAVMAILLFGVNTILWGSVGLARVIRSRWHPEPPPAGRRVAVEEVAILIAAHNEATVIEDSIDAAVRHVVASQIYVASDGSTDDTAVLARERGVNVVELSPNRGKAGALVAAIEHFQLADRYEIVLLLDADTRLDPGYLVSGLPPFDDPGVVAVAGRATTIVDPPPPTRFGRFLVAYRERFYIIVQYLLKYGQAARSANVVSIVPGFASMYRTRILHEIDIAAPGLVIEDFNMTFEVHAKNLGRIAFRPGAAVAHTQDPDNLHDYVRQVHRWTLGFWQTIRRHRVRSDRFWGALALYVTELVLADILLLLAVPAMLLSAVALVWAGATGDEGALAALPRLVPPQVVLLGILIPDLLLTCFAAVIARRPSYLLYGPAFPLMRCIDAALCLRSLVQAYGRGSATGRWTSPVRRPQASTATEPRSP